MANEQEHGPAQSPKASRVDEHRAGETASRAAGGALGAIAGAAAGAATGALGGPLGMAAGGVAGAVIGGGAGGNLMDSQDRVAAEYAAARVETSGSPASGKSSGHAGNSVDRRDEDSDGAPEEGGSHPR